MRCSVETVPAGVASSTPLESTAWFSHQPPAHLLLEVTWGLSNPSTWQCALPCSIEGLLYLLEKKTAHGSACTQPQTADADLGTVVCAQGIHPHFPVKQT